MNSVSSISGMAAMVMVAAIAGIVAVQYRLFFIVAGVISVVGGLAVFRIPPSTGTNTRTRFVLRRKFSVYYVLNFLDGARRQMFQTFAPFALVKIYGLDVTMIALLMFASNALSFLSSPYLGKLIDRLGPRTMLSISWVLMIGDFLGYAYLRNIPVLMVLYALNSILMVVSSISGTTYINGLSSLTDLTPSLAMGVTMNHVAAVILPLTGGILWNLFGYEATFIIGVAVALLSLVTAQKVKMAKE